MKWWAVTGATTSAAVIDVKTPGCLSCQSMCSSCSPGKASAPPSVALVTMAPGLAPMVWSEIKGLYLVMLRALVMPKAANRCPQMRPVHDLHTLLIFWHSLTLIFTTVLPLCLHHNLPSYETCSIYPAFHNSQFCRSCTQTYYL